MTKILHIIATSAVLLFISCDKHVDEREYSSDLAVIASITSFDFESSDLSGRKADMGIFVTESESSEINGENSNIRYTADFYKGIFPLEPAENAVVLPSDGRLVDLYAYHPYTTSLYPCADASFTFYVNLANQNDLQPEMLLLSKVEKHSSALNKVCFNLKPVFSKIRVNLSLGQMTRSADLDVSIKLEGIPCRAYIDVISGQYMEISDPQTTEMVRKDASVLLFEAVVLSCQIPEESSIVLTISDDNGLTILKSNLKELIEATEENKLYDLSLTVLPEGFEATLAGVSDFYVSNWNEDSDNITGEVKQSQK